MFRHAGWAIPRLKTWQALVRIHTSPRKLARFACCGAGARLQVRDDQQRVRLVADRCGDRWCQPCARARATTLEVNLRALMGRAPTRFITLTLRASRTPLKDQLNRLYRCFALLLRTPLWRSHCTGGAAVLELKLGRGSGLWHPHLHIVTNGRYIDQRQLSDCWYSITGDSTIVDVRRTTDATGNAAYLAKYITKPCSHSIYSNPERLDEAIVSLRGRRLVRTFGTWRGSALNAKPIDDHTWTDCGSFEELVDAAAAGDSDALRVVLLWRSQTDPRPPPTPPPL